MVPQRAEATRNSKLHTRLKERARCARMTVQLVRPHRFHIATLLAALLLVTWSLSAIAGPVKGAHGAGQTGGASVSDIDNCDPPVQGSPYIPVDSWVYPALLRLYALGYLDSSYLGMRPWTRSSIRQMLESTGDSLEDAAEDDGPDDEEPQRIYKAVMHELNSDPWSPCRAQRYTLRIESNYTAVRGISGVALRDSFHLGSTIINDFGRPYENGLNNYSGASGYASAGRFTLYLRGEFQAAPSAAGYSSSLAQMMSTIDGTTFTNPATGKPYSQATIPQGPIGAKADVRLLEAYVSANYLNHEISFGKLDAWLGPGAGSAMAYSNNAENIYAFRIDRVEPLEIPLLSHIAGPFRYEFLVGPLRGHTYMPNSAYVANPEPDVANVINPGDPWVHVEKVSFKPDANLELGFERTVIWGGKGHEPITIRSFLRSFISLSSPVCASPSASDPHPPCAKDDRNDPGARFGAFDFTYRLPFLRKWLTLYADSEVHDDVSPISSPSRASWRPGLYLSHFPKVPKLDLRAEAVTTDTSISNSPQFGHYMYWETIQRQGYTNRGQLFGDWIGREDKGGQAWMTYHLSGNEWLQVGVRDQKATTVFIPGGTTLSDINFQAVKRIGKEIEINGSFAYERWKAPIYSTGTPSYPAPLHSVTTTNIQFTWYPGWRAGK